MSDERLSQDFDGYVTLYKYFVKQFSAKNSRGWTYKTQNLKMPIFFAGTIWCSLHFNNILLFDFFSHLKCPNFSVKVEIFAISALSSSFY